MEDPIVQLTTEVITGLASALLSLAAAYLPGVKQRYQALSGTKKRLVMAGLLVAVAAGSFALGCGGIETRLLSSASCDRAGVVHLVELVFEALVINQGVFLLAVKDKNADASK